MWMDSEWGGSIRTQFLGFGARIQFYITKYKRHYGYKIFLYCTRYRGGALTSGKAATLDDAKLRCEEALETLLTLHARPQEPTNERTSTQEVTEDVMV